MIKRSPGASPGNQATEHAYELQERFFDGRIGLYYHAVHKNDNRKVVIKAVDKAITTNSKETFMLQRDIDIMYSVRSPYILRLLDFFSDHENYYIVTSYCSGETLNDNIKTHNRLREKQASVYFYQMAKAVSALHDQGIAHHNISSKAFLITKYGLKLNNFGIATFEMGNEKPRYFGMPCYLPPECYDKKIPHFEGIKSDLWSLGVVLYEMVTGHFPWSMSSEMGEEIENALYEIPDYVSEPCADLIKALLQVNPSKRLTCNEILDSVWMRMGTPKKIELARCLPQLSPLLPRIQDSKGQNKLISPFEDPLPQSPLKHKYDIKRRSILGSCSTPLFLKEKNKGFIPKDNTFSAIQIQATKTE